MKRLHVAAVSACAVLVALLAPQPALAADASYRTLGAAQNPDWMAPLADATSLAALSIPGTHETMSIHGGALTQTQENFGDSGGTLARQLTAGIRMIDIRARVNTGNTFTIHHGASYQNANFDDVLTKLREFLAAHPRRDRGDAPQAGVHRRVRVLHRRLRPARLRRHLRHVRGPLPEPVLAALGEPVDRGGDARTRRDPPGGWVLAVLHGPRGGVIGRYGLAQFAGWDDASSTYVQDEYNVPNIGAIATKRDQVRRFLDATSAGDPALMYVNFTSGASIFAQPQQVAGGAFGVQGVNPFLLTYLNEGPEVHTPVVRTGMLMFDFPGSGLISKVISLNR